MTTTPTISPYGIWHVTTEGDCEGRTTKDLGVHEGFLDDIAFALAGSVCYKLQFDPVDIAAWERSSAAATKVHVSLSIGAGHAKTWDMQAGQRVAWFQRVLHGRDVSVEPSNYYAAVTLVRGSDAERQDEARKRAARENALAKLTPADRAALGLDD